MYLFGLENYIFIREKSGNLKSGVCGNYVVANHSDDH